MRLLVDSGNRTAWQRLRSPRPDDGRPLLLCGPPGSGKSQLLRCLAERWRADGLAVRSVTALDLVEEALPAVRAGRRDLLAPLGRIDLLLVDDVFPLVGKDSWVEHLGRELERLATGGVRVVIACDAVETCPLALAGAEVLEVRPLGLLGRTRLAHRELGSPTAWRRARHLAHAETDPHALVGRAASSRFHHDLRRRAVRATPRQRLRRRRLVHWLAVA